MRIRKVATGEVLDNINLSENASVEELQAVIARHPHGIPMTHQVLRFGKVTICSRHGEARLSSFGVSDSSEIELFSSLNGGCGESLGCNLCGLGCKESCCCTMHRGKPKSEILNPHGDFKEFFQRQ